MSKGEASIEDEESKPSCKRQMKSEQQQDWTDLPKDFWIPILERLPWSERVRLSLVCKSWKQCIHEIQNTQEFLLWLMCYRWQETEDGRVESICKLGDPYARKLYIVEETTKGREREIFVRAIPCATSQGWLLFSKLSCGRKHLFLYSPFTDEVIRFPELERCIEDKFSFSLNPGYPDCIVIALSIPQPGKLEIKTCHPGDESWETFVVWGEYRFISDVGYADESFYVAFTHRELGAFNVKKREWTLWNLQLEKPSPQIGFSFIHLIGAFDEALEKQVIIRGSPFFSPFSVPAEGNARESVGKTNYFVYGSTLPRSASFYCIGSQRSPGPPKEWFVTFYCVGPTTPPTLSKDYEWMENYDLRKIWIQPPLQRIWRASDLICFNLAQNVPT